MSKRKVHRDAGTGEFVTEAEAKARPAETVTETVQRPLGITVEPGPHPDSYVIEGTLFSADFFRHFAEPMPGVLYLLERDENGVVVIVRLERSAVETWLEEHPAHHPA